MKENVNWTQKILNHEVLKRVGDKLTILEIINKIERNSLQH